VMELFLVSLMSARTLPTLLGGILIVLLLACWTLQVVWTFQPVIMVLSM